MKLWRTVSRWFFLQLAFGFLRAQRKKEIAVAIERGRATATERKAAMEALLAESQFPVDWSIDLLLADMDGKQTAQRLREAQRIWQ